MLILALIAAPSSASELNTDADNTLNVFVAGTTAVAADVNDNFSKVAGAVNDNSDRIDDNAAASATNAAAITTLQADKLGSANLGGALDTAATTAGHSIDGNAAAIGVNAAAIAVHTTAISTQASDIAANTTAIAGKLSTSSLGAALDTATTTAGNSIDENAADIASNAAAISDNAGETAASIVDIQNLQQNANRAGIACAGNDGNDVMVRVGPLCVDVYEASLWDSATGGSAIDASTCADNGNDCSADPTKIYARSVANTAPDADVTWFQALQACANSGKRLLTNAEWQMAAAGTPDPGATVDVANNCNTNSGVATNTGASAAGTNACVSNWGVFDMIGNLNEWTADWMHGAGTTGSWAPSTGTAGANYGNDLMSGTNPAPVVNQGTGTNFPGAIYRGGAFLGGTGAGVFSVVSNVAPSYKGNNIGFRCAR